MKQVDIQDTQLTILISIDGQMHMTAFDKDEFEFLSTLIKRGVKAVIPTKATESQLNKLLRGGCKCTHVDDATELLRALKVSSWASVRLALKSFYRGKPIPSLIKNNLPLTR